MAIRRFSTAEPGVKSNKFWDQDTQQGAMVPIATVYGTGASATALTFSNIPQGYQDLRLVVRGGSTPADNLILVTFNGSYTTNLSGTRLSSNGSAASSTRNSGAYTIDIGSCGTFITGGFSSTVDILNYANTSIFKPMLVKTFSDLNGSGGISVTAGIWRSTSALTSFQFNTATSVAFQVGTTATLYGIKASV